MTSVTLKGEKNKPIMTTESANRLNANAPAVWVLHWTHCTKYIAHRRWTIVQQWCLLAGTRLKNAQEINFLLWRDDSDGKGIIFLAMLSQIVEILNVAQLKKKWPTAIEGYKNLSTKMRLSSTPAIIRLVPSTFPKMGRMKNILKIKVRRTFSTLDLLKTLSIVCTL